MTKSKDIIIEKNKRFSESIFWYGQRQFYHEKGASAWAGEVPFYITSNPFIANCYAQLLLRFFQDWIQQNPNARKHPFYVIELGAGPGQFSFYVLKAITELMRHFQLTDLKLVYVMTDFTVNNLEFWKNHPQLKLFIDSKILDFALFDIEQDQIIRTIKNNFTINPKTCKNPLVVFANYLFDSIINDIFYIKKNKIYSSLVTLKTAEKNIKNGTPKDWQKVVVHHKEYLVDSNYYKDPILDRILAEYADSVKEGYLLFPIGCLRGLKNLQKMCNNRLLLCTSDKGHTTLAELQELEYPELDFHGSFSLMVNYHAIANYFKLCQGSEFFQTPRDGLTTAAFSSGFVFDNLLETKYVLQNSFEGFSPTDFFNFYELFEKFAKTSQLKWLASVLCLSNWDPFLFESFAKRLTDLCVKENTEVIDYLIANFAKIADNFYYIPGAEDIFFSIGYLFYELDFFDEAIQYFLKSRQYDANNFELLYDLALCYFYNKDYTNAAAIVTEALKIDPKAKDAKNLLRSIKSKKTGSRGKKSC